MIDLQRGTVIAIDRVNRQVTAVLDGMTGPIKASYSPRRGRMPWPLAMCWFDNAPAYRCLGPIGDRRRALHDDFLHVPTLSAASGAFAGDTQGWQYTSFSTTVAISQGRTGAGSLLFTAFDTTTNGQGIAIQKDAACCTPPAGTGAFHVSARMAVSSVSPNTLSWIGLSDTPLGGPANEVVITIQQGAFFSFFCRDPGGTSSQTLQATIPQVNTFYDLDIIWAPAFAAGWVDGDGPYVLTSHLPAAANSPLLRTASTRSTASSLTVDYYDLALVSPVIDPSRLTLSAAA